MSCCSFNVLKLHTVNYILLLLRPVYRCAAFLLKLTYDNPDFAAPSPWSSYWGDWLLSWKARTGVWWLSADQGRIGNWGKARESRHKKDALAFFAMPVCGMLFPFNDYGSSRCSAILPMEEAYDNPVPVFSSCDPRVITVAATDNFNNWNTKFKLICYRAMLSMVAKLKLINADANWNWAGNASPRRRNSDSNSNK